MSNFATGMATGYVIGNSSNYGDIIGIQLCMTHDTREQQRACLQKIKHDNEKDAMYFIIFMVIAMVLFIAWALYEKY